MPEPDVSNLHSVAQAIEMIDSVPVSPRVVARPLLKSAGLRLAHDIVADRDYPPFEKSLMDGFAIRANDATSERFTLRLVGEIAAGSATSRVVGPGECMAIYTGAPMPDGADSVVPVEFVESRDGESVTLRAPVRIGQNIARRGADCSVNQVRAGGKRRGGTALGRRGRGDGEPAGDLSRYRLAEGGGSRGRAGGPAWHPPRRGNA
jgi:molybdopterin biosynthesis enzyme